VLELPDVGCVLELPPAPLVETSWRPPHAPREATASSGPNQASLGEFIANGTLSARDRASRSPRGGSEGGQDDPQAFPGKAATV
jgi:hypothetical protein